MFKGIYTGIEREERIKREYARISVKLDDLDAKRKVTLDRLFHEAAFMAVTLEEARLIIQRDSIIEEYQNGANQTGLKKSSAVEVYDKMINTYAKILDQINKTMPEPIKTDPANEINDFINEGK